MFKKQLSGKSKFRSLNGARKISGAFRGFAKKL